MCRSEFLAIRLKWAELEAARLRGEEVDEDRGPTTKPQAKKKEKAEVVEKVEDLAGRCDTLSRTAIIEEGCFSRTQVWAWTQEIGDRKERPKKQLPESTVEHAAELAGRYPWLGGRKAKGYLTYHGLGVIGEKAYDRVRDNVKRAMVQELSGRKDFEREEAGPKERRSREGPGRVWAEDFTELCVRGVLFKLAVLIDTFHRLYLGWEVSRRADEDLVSRPVKMALHATNGQGPEEFLISDRGSQYTSKAHELELTSQQIVHRLIPACRPDYNSEVESEMRLIKELFYCEWEERVRRQGEPKTMRELEQGVRETLGLVFELLNEKIPRPYLKGVTPSDVQHGREQAAQNRVEAYVRSEQGRNVSAWRRGYWEVVKESSKVGEMSTQELRTKLAFGGRSPLRRIAKLNRKAQLKRA
jgi:transposase InsO family protein